MINLGRKKSLLEEQQVAHKINGKAREPDLGNKSQNKPAEENTSQVLSLSAGTSCILLLAVMHHSLQIQNLVEMSG
jgi:hypothetical protein